MYSRFSKPRSFRCLAATSQGGSRRNGRRSRSRDLQRIYLMCVGHIATLCVHVFICGYGCAYAFDCVCMSVMEWNVNMFI